MYICIRRKRLMCIQLNFIQFYNYLADCWNQTLIKVARFAYKMNSMELTMNLAFLELIIGLSFS